MIISDDSEHNENLILDTNQDWFTTYEPVRKCVVMMGNNIPCKIASICNIRIKIFDGMVGTLGNVRHVPNLKRYIISLSILDSKVYRYIGDARILKVSKGAIIVMNGQKRSQLDVLHGSTITVDAVVTKLRKKDTGLEERFGEADLVTMH